ncbi:MAG: hypothetical protein IJ632_02225 [Muribaculaceae bacterium]|nr:hypothetical protein [Muribaculaceae bacterium]
MNKKLITLVLTGLLLGGCTGGNKNDNNQATDETAAHKCIKPLPAGFSADSLTDCTVEAAFTIADIDWKAQTITMNVFAKNIYDAVDVQQMQAGDTLVLDKQQLVVNTVENLDGTKEVNGGIEEGGALLSAGDGGTYVATQLDDHPVYSLVGKVTLPLSPELVFIDCGEEPLEPGDTVTSQVARHIQSLDGWRKEFIELNTQVQVQGGVVTQIARHWIP